MMVRLPHMRILIAVYPLDSPQIRHSSIPKPLFGLELKLNSLILVSRHHVCVLRILPASFRSPQKYMFAVV